MNKKERKKILWWADTATFADWIFYVLLMLFLIAGIAQGSDSDKLLEGMGVMGLALFIALLRLRMLIRAIRVDALIREAEEEARREAYRA